MGDLIHLAARRAERNRQTLDLPPTFFFDVSDPLSYLAAEYVERSLGGVEWIAVAGNLVSGRVGSDLTAVREHAETRARALRLPLVWPDTFPAATRCALRAAAYACEIGAGAQFALAAGRLAFCGGFDLEDPEVLTEAAAAAGVPLDGCLEAAGESSRDGDLIELARALRAHEVSELPAVTIGGRWFTGDAALLGAGAIQASSYRAGGLAAVSGRYEGPLAPVG